MAANPVDALIADCEAARERVNVARKELKDAQSKLRGLLTTHGMVGNILTPEQAARIAELAPERKPRKV